MTIFSKIINGEIPCYRISQNEKFFAFLTSVGNNQYVLKDEFVTQRQVEQHEVELVVAHEIEGVFAGFGDVGPDGIRL